MRIHQLLSGLEMPVTNEEHTFIENHQGPIRITALDEKSKWLAQNLVRKGIYNISDDNLTLIKKSK